MERRPSRSARPRGGARPAAGRAAGAPGERLGAERDLAERLGVSRSTIRAALADLERNGVVRRARGRGGGIFVAERKVERDLTQPRRAARPTCAARASSPTRACCRRRRSRPTPRPPPRSGWRGGLVLEVVRVRLADGEPISLERALFPAERFPGAARPLARRLAVRAAPGATTGSSRARRRSGSRWWRPARPRRGCSGCARGAPLLTVARTTWDADGRAVRALARPVPRRPRPDRGARARAAPTWWERRAGLVTACTPPSILVQCAKLVGQLRPRGTDEEKGS